MVVPREQLPGDPALVLSEQHRDPLSQGLDRLEARPRLGRGHCDALAGTVIHDHESWSEPAIGPRVSGTGHAPWTSAPIVSESDPLAWLSPPQGRRLASAARIPQNRNYSGGWGAVVPTGVAPPQGSLGSEPAVDRTAVSFRALPSLPTWALEMQTPGGGGGGL